MMCLLSQDAAEELKNSIERLDWKPDMEGMPSVRVIDLFSIIDFLCFDTVFGCSRQLPTA